MKLQSWWKVTEIHHLKKWYGIKPVVEIAKDLERSCNAVRLQASKLGLKRSKLSRKPKRSAEVLIDLAIEGYNKKEIADMWGVSAKSVHNSYRDRKDISYNIYQMMLNNGK